MLFCQVPRQHSICDYGAKLYAGGFASRKPVELGVGRRVVYAARGFRPFARRYA